MVNTNQLNDMPAEKDALGLDRYFKGLSEYILECPTPMTIAIQGGWGTGKTTAMNMIKARISEASKLSRSCVQIDFNTWQYAKTAGSNLFLPLLRRMNDEIGKEIEARTGSRDIPGDAEKEPAKNGAEARKTAKEPGNGEAAPPEEQEKRKSIRQQFEEKKKVIGRTALLMGNSLAAVEKSGIAEAFMRFVQSAVQGAVQDASDRQAKKDFSEESGLIYDYIAGLKEHLDDEIQFLQEKLGVDRIVFFVDDLDRLEPENAVSFLEDLKNFMQCENCVFVLALDHEIVRRGLRSKYSFDLGSTDKSRADDEAEYAARFFDKLIQLPFNLPCQQYDVEKYVTSLLGSGRGSKKDAEAFADIIRAFGDTNPRSIKRLFMIYSMYERIGNPLYAGHKNGLFALLLLQMNHEDLYKSLLAAVETDLMDQNTAFLDIFSDPEAEYPNVDGWFKTEESGRNRGIAKKIEELLVSDGRNEGKYGALFDVIGTTAITGNSGGSGQPRVEETKTLIEEYLERLRFRREKRRLENGSIKEEHIGPADGDSVEVRDLGIGERNHVNINIGLRGKWINASPEEKKQYVREHLLPGEEFEIRLDREDSGEGMDILCNYPKYIGLRRISVTDRASMKFVGRVLRNIAATGRMF